MINFNAKQYLCLLSVVFGVFLILVNTAAAEECCTCSADILKSDGNIVQCIAPVDNCGLDFCLDMQDNLPSLAERVCASIIDVGDEVDDEGKPIKKDQIIAICNFYEEPEPEPDPDPGDGEGGGEGPDPGPGDDSGAGEGEGDESGAGEGNGEESGVSEPSGDESGATTVSTEITSPGGTVSMKDVPLTNPLTGEKGGFSISKIIKRIIQFALGLTGVLALAAFVYGGVLWMISAGTQSFVTKGKQVMIWALVGLVVVFGSYAIVELIFTLFTG